jgi:hypothetical protein
MRTRKEREKKYSKNKEEGSRQKLIIADEQKNK